MGLRFPVQQNCCCFFVTTTFAEHRPYGNVRGLYEALMNSLAFYCDKYSANLSGYVLMPSHLHLLLFIEGKRLGPFMRDFKKYIAQKAARDLGIRTSQLWAPRFDRLAINSDDVFRSRLHYIHNNPVKAGLAPEAALWEWSSAVDYEQESDRELVIYKQWG